MIRINLAKTHSYSGTGQTQTAITAPSLNMGSVGETPAAKVAALLILPLLLFAYEQYTISIKEDKLAEKQAHIENLKKQIASYGPVENVIEDLMREKEKVNEQLKVIQKISEKRAFKLKAILAIQENLPDDLWLKAMSINQDALTVQGISRTPTSVQQIVANLNKSSVIESAVSKELKRVKLRQEHVQEFDIEARIKK